MLEFNFQPFPELITERLRLRETTMDDVHDLFLLRNDDRVRIYIDRPKETEEEVEKKLKGIIEDTKKGDNILWTICTLENSKMIGTTGFWNFNKKNHRVEIGYSLFPDFWNKGFMSEANQVILKYAFEQMKVHSIQANINPNNIASKRVLEKMGFRQEAYFTEDYFYDGKFTDSMIFSLLERWFNNH